jgi:hypothetical protein
MADNPKGRLYERMQYYQELRANGAWEQRFRLPTREDYRQWLIVDTEGPVAGPFFSEQAQRRWEELHALRLDRDQIDANTENIERDIQEQNEASPQQAAGYHKEGHCL